MTEPSPRDRGPRWGGEQDRARREAQDREADRQLNELTGELRVLLAAATVLLAFLLTVPFSSRFGQVADFNQAAYFLAFVSTALAVVLFLGETAYHRLAGRHYDKSRLVATASRQAVGGIALLGVALGGVVFLVTEVLYSTRRALLVLAAVLAAAAVTWFVIPLLRRRG